MSLTEFTAETTVCRNPAVPYFNENLWKLMKTSDAALRKAIKTRRDIDMPIYKGLRNKVFQEPRLAKSRFYQYTE